jgi:hypothetical protein
MSAVFRKRTVVPTATRLTVGAKLQTSMRMTAVPSPSM